VNASAVIRSEAQEVPLLAPKEFRPELTRGITELGALPEWISGYESDVRQIGEEKVTRGGATALAIVR
jgi:hypothetical protein